MAQFDASEAGLRNFKDFLSIYNQMSEMCFNRCVINLNHRQLTEEEQTGQEQQRGKEWWWEVQGRGLQSEEMLQHPPYLKGQQQQLGQLGGL